MKRPTNPTYALDHIEWDRKASPSGEDDEIEVGDVADDPAAEQADTYTHPDVVAAANWLAETLRERGIEADYSPASLLALDGFMSDSVSTQLPGSRDFFSEDLSYRTFAVGAYVGEVIRRTVGGEWNSDERDPLVEINIALQFNESDECFPMKRVLERLNDGPGSSFTQFAVECGLEIPEAPEDAVAEGPRSPEDFNVRGFVMLWHTPATNHVSIEYHFAADTTACVNLLGYFTFLETKTIPSLKSIAALTSEDGVVLPESHVDGSTRSQMGIFYDPELAPDYWHLVDDNDQLYIEMGHDRLIEFKDAVTKIFLGHDTPVIGKPGEYLQLWPKAKTDEAEEAGDADPSEAEA